MKTDFDAASAWQTILHTWETGGWVMIALALIGVAIYAMAARLLMTLHYPGIKHCTDADVKRWLADPSQAPARVRPMIEHVRQEAGSTNEIEGRFREIEAHLVPGVDRSLTTLGVMVVAAPLFGLLGTVSGMLLTFKAISLGGSSVSEIVAKGISEALVATQTGLTVAIPGWMVTFVAKRWRAEFVAFLMRLESITLRSHGRPGDGLPIAGPQVVATRRVSRPEPPAMLLPPGAQPAGSSV